jgi:hypothetical protein
MLERLHPHNNKNIFLLNIVQNSMNHIALQKKTTQIVVIILTFINRFF